MNKIFFSNGQVNYSAVARVIGCCGSAAKAAIESGIDPRDFEAVRAFVLSHRSRAGKARASKRKDKLKNDPLTAKVAELRAQKLGMRVIAAMLGISRAMVRNRSRKTGFGEMVSLNKVRPEDALRRKTERVIMCEYRKEALVMRRFETWAEHPFVVRECARLRYHRTKTPKSMAKNAEYARRRHAKFKHDPQYRKLRKKVMNTWKARPRNRMRMNLGQRLARILSKKGLVKSESMSKLVGCSLQALRNHLEARFTRKMTWKNYGKVWHVDHIVPCSYFDLTKVEQQRKCFHYSNLRPLDAMQNMKEGNRRGYQTLPLGI